MKEQLDQTTQALKENIQKLIADYREQTGISVTAINIRIQETQTFNGTFINIPVEGIKLSSTI
jgi:uncharacterized alkaline shock family protein YloU